MDKAAADVANKKEGATGKSPWGSTILSVDTALKWYQQLC